MVLSMKQINIFEGGQQCFFVLPTGLLIYNLTLSTKEITMKNVIIELSTQEFIELLQAHKKMTEFLERVVPLNELYLQEFLNDLKIAEDEVKANQFEEVKTFNDFIS